MPNSTIVQIKKLLILSALYSRRPSFKILYAYFIASQTYIGLHSLPDLSEENIIYDVLYPKKLALTSPTSGGRSFV
jgi:hypothetical protein